MVVDTTVILDIGRGFVKAGFSTDAGGKPRVVFPSGTMIQPQKGYRLLWDEGYLEDRLQEAFERLEVDPETVDVFVTEAPFEPKHNRYRLCEILLDRFQVASMSLAITGVLALYTTGSDTGVVVESGHGVTCAVPVVNGYPFRHAAQRWDFSGRDLSDFLGRLLLDGGFRQFASPSAASTASAIKERLCYVAQDYGEELRRAKADPLAVQRFFDLPDGGRIALNDERFRCPEALFNPQKMLGIDAPGIHQMTLQSIKKSDVDVRRQLSSGIFLTGGTMLLEGMRGRMAQELSAALPRSDVRVELASDPTNSSFQGACIMASCRSGSKAQVSKKMWMDEGYSFVQRVCPSLRIADAAS